MLDLLEVPNRAWPCEGSPWRPLPFASSPGSERLPPVQGTDTELLLHRPCFCWCWSLDLMEQTEAPQLKEPHVGCDCCCNGLELPWQFW